MLGHVGMSVCLLRGPGQQPNTQPKSLSEKDDIILTQLKRHLKLTSWYDPV